MNRNSCALVVVSLLFAAEVYASAPRTFVAPTGVDTNPCSLTDPCRSFQAAVNATSSGGEVIALGSAGYGTVLMVHPISIIAPTGIYAGVTVTIHAGVPAIDFPGLGTIALRGLTLNGNGIGGTGVGVGSGAVLYVENCVFSGFTNTAIDVGEGEGFIKDTFIRASDTGIAVYAGKAVVDHVRLEKNRIGLRSDEGAKVIIRDSVSAGNTDDAFYAFNGYGAQAILEIENCMISNNGNGVREFFSIVLLSNCIITGNTGYGVQGSGGLIYSSKNNTVFGNGTDVSATITPVIPI